MAIMNDLQHWKIVFGILGNIISVLVYLSPVPTFYRIHKKKSTESFQSLPYQVALFSSMLWLYYALLSENALLLITINAFGCIVETVYVTMYLAYAPKDKKVSAIKLFVAMNVVAFSSILLLTRFLVDDVKSRNVVLGWICVAVSVSVFAAPLSILARVIRTRSVEFMPFTLSFFLTISAVMWFAYGLLLKDICVALPNIIGFFLGTLQMILYAVYRNSEKVMTENSRKQTEQMKTIMVLSPLGASQVYSINAVQSDAKVEEDVKEKDEQTDDQQVKSKELSSHHNPQDKL